MTTCLLCPSPVVADSLCVPCGAKKWAAWMLLNRPSDVAFMLANPVPTEWLKPEHSARPDALRKLTTVDTARAFLNRLEAARKARDAAPLCSRGCVSHEDLVTPRHPQTSEPSVLRAWARESRPLCTRCNRPKALCTCQSPHNDDKENEHG